MFERLVAGADRARTWRGIARGGAIAVAGTLTTEGTAEDPVLFRGEDSAPGSWNSLVIGIRWRIQRRIGFRSRSLSASATARPGG